MKDAYIYIPILLPTSFVLILLLIPLALFLLPDGLEDVQPMLIAVMDSSSDTTNNNNNQQYEKTVLYLWLLFVLQKMLLAFLASCSLFPLLSLASSLGDW